MSNKHCSVENPFLVLFDHFPEENYELLLFIREGVFIGMNIAMQMLTIL